MLLSVSLQLSAEDQLFPSEAVRKMLVVEYFQVEICGVNVSVYRMIRLPHNKGSYSHNYQSWGNLNKKFLLSSLFLATTPY